MPSRFERHGTSPKPRTLEFRAFIHIDSVVTETFNNIDSRKCFAYTVYLTEAESFPATTREQHVNSHIGTQKIPGVLPGAQGRVQDRLLGRALDPNTAFPPGTRSQAGHAYDGEPGDGEIQRLSRAALRSNAFTRLRNEHAGPSGSFALCGFFLAACGSTEVAPADDGRGP